MHNALLICLTRKWCFREPTYLSQACFVIHCIITYWTKAKSIRSSVWWQNGGFTGRWELDFKWCWSRHSCVQPSSHSTGVSIHSNQRPLSLDSKELELCVLGEGQILSDPDCLRAAVNLMIWFVRHPKVSWRREVKRPGCLTWHFEVKEVDSDFWAFPNKGLSTPWDSVLMRMMIAMKIILIWCRLWKNASLCQSAIMFQHATLIQCNWQENHGQSWRCRDLSTISTIWAFLVRAWHLWLKFGVSEI